MNSPSLTGPLHRIAAIVLVSCYLVFTPFAHAAVAANNLILSQRNAANNDNTTRYVTATANSLLGFSGASPAVAGLVTVGGNLTLSGGTLNLSAAPNIQVASGTSLTLSGTGGAGYVTFPSQAASPSTPASGFVEFADSAGRRSWRRAADTFVRTWDATLTADRVYTLPDAASSFPVFSQTITFSGPTAARTVTLPDANFTAARTDAAQSFTGIQTILGTSTLKFGATAQASIGASADTTAGVMTFTAPSSGSISLMASGGKILLGVATPNASTAGLVQLPRGAGSLTSGFCIENDTVFYSPNAGTWAIDHVNGTSPALLFRNNGTTKSYISDSAGVLTIASGSATTALTFSTTQVGTFASNVIVSGSAGVAIASGANKHAGTFTLVAGTVTVSNTSITANSVVCCTVKTSGGTLGTGSPEIVINAGVGFTATGIATDTSTYNFVVFEVN